MIEAFKNNYRSNLVITVLFFISIAISIYFLFRLPSLARIPAGYTSQLTIVYIVLGISFILGVVALVRALSYRDELIVYRDKTREMSQEEQDSEDARNEISLDTVKGSLKSSHGEGEIIQSGLNALCKQINAGQGAFYRVKQVDEKKVVELTAGYALTVNENNTVSFDFGEGLIGQAAASAQLLYLDELPEGYIKIISGLGSASPKFLLISPVKNGDTVTGVIEVATFSEIDKNQRKFIEQGSQLIAEKLNKT